MSNKALLVFNKELSEQDKAALFDLGVLVGTLKCCGNDSITNGELSCFCRLYNSITRMCEGVTYDDFSQALDNCDKFIMSRALSNGRLHDASEYGIVDADDTELYNRVMSNGNLMTHITIAMRNVKSLGLFNEHKENVLDKFEHEMEQALNKVD